jgi:hypothetical protein
MRGVWRVNIKDPIGRRRIASLVPYDVERYFRELKAAGLTQASVRYVRAVLHRACRLARKWSNNTLPNPITDTELAEWSLADTGPGCAHPPRKRCAAFSLPRSTTGIHGCRLSG